MTFKSGGQLCALIGLDFSRLEMNTLYSLVLVNMKTGLIAVLGCRAKGCCHVWTRP